MKKGIKNDSANFGEDLIKIKSDIVLTDEDGNIIEVKTPRPEIMHTL